MLSIRLKKQTSKTVADTTFKLTLLEICLMTALTYGMEAWEKYKTSGDERNREDIRKGTKKDILTFSFNNLYWYHNGNRNMTNRAKDQIWYTNALS